MPDPPATDPDPMPAELRAALTDEERAWRADWWERTTRQRAKRNAEIAHFHRLRERLQAEIDAATDALADLNRRTVRDVLRGLLGRHPELERIGINLSTAFNDDTYGFGVDGLWLNDLYVRVDGLIGAPAYEPFPGFHYRPEWTAPDPRIQMGHPDDRVAREQQVWNDPDLRTPADRTARLSLLQREAYGSLYDVAVDAVAAISALRPFGPHLWVDGFGYGATVEATREEMTIRPEYMGPEDDRREGDPDRFARIERDAGIPLGSVTTAYASDPARAPHVAVRLARSGDLRHVLGRLIGLGLDAARDRLMVPGRVSEFAIVRPRGWIEGVRVGGFEVPLNENSWWADGPWRPAVEAMEALAAQAPRRLDDGREVHFDDVHRLATDAWVQALNDRGARFGRRDVERAFAWLS